MKPKGKQMKSMNDYLDKDGMDACEFFQFMVGDF